MRQWFGWRGPKRRTSGEKDLVGESDVVDLEGARLELEHAGGVERQRLVVLEPGHVHRRRRRQRRQRRRQRRVAVEARRVADADDDVARLLVETRQRRHLDAQEKIRFLLSFPFDSRRSIDPAERLFHPFECSSMADSLRMAASFSKCSQRETPGNDIVRFSMLETDRRFQVGFDWNSISCSSSASGLADRGLLWTNVIGSWRLGNAEDDQ